MSPEIIHKLPPYPSARGRKSLSPTQLANLNQIIAQSLLQTISLPFEKCNTPASHTFLDTYLRDVAHIILDNLIWGTQGSEKKKLSNDEKAIKSRALALAQKLATSKDGLAIQTLLNLCIVYGPSSSRPVLASSLQSHSTQLPKIVTEEVVPAFTLHLSPTHAAGLYALRKTAHIILRLLLACPPELIKPFAYSTEFILALGKAYDEGLTTIARSYGGLSLSHLEHSSSSTARGDDWEHVWLETKVSLIDAFHALLTSMLTSLSSAPNDNALAATSEHAFSIIFALLDLQSTSSGVVEERVPFLNQSLLADYQNAYDLSHTLERALQASAAERDARLDLLSAQLASTSQEQQSGNGGSKNPGALKFLLRGSGIAPGIDNLGKVTKYRPEPQQTLRSGISSNNKGKTRAAAEETVIDEQLDIKVTQVLDILPDQDVEYVRALLRLPEYSDAERVVGALLEGSAPPPETLLIGGNVGSTNVAGGYAPPSRAEEEEDELVYMQERRNIWDEEEMDLSKVHVGKKVDTQESIFRDENDINKADILRRVEEMDLSDLEEEEDTYSKSSTSAKKSRMVADDGDDLDLGDGVHVIGDGEESGADSSADEDGDGDEQEQVTPETILELAYIRDSKVLDRDAQTRRSKARTDLKAQTSMSDEQIEGWKIMLERNPKAKAKVLAKHEFSGNHNLAHPVIASSSNQGGRGASGQGNRGRGGGRGRGRGRGGGEGAGNDSARQRAWKDKNKSRQANHNRKRGHDKKMARAAPPPV